MTNGDRIRNLGDEGLAEVMTIFLIEGFKAPAIKNPNDGKQNLIKWLKQEGDSNNEC